jgi:hypothetical protein
LTPPWIENKGNTKNNFYTLYDVAMLGITNPSKVPLRLATMTGFIVALMSLLVALGYFGYKLIFWDNFQVGMAPLVIGLFFFRSTDLHRHHRRIHRRHPHPSAEAAAGHRKGTD